MSVIVCNPDTAWALAARKTVPDPTKFDSLAPGLSLSARTWDILMIKKQAIKRTFMCAGKEYMNLFML
jgi:hypothetical protein